MSSVFSSEDQAMRVSWKDLSPQVSYVRHEETVSLIKYRCLFFPEKQSANDNYSFHYDTGSQQNTQESTEKIMESVTKRKDPLWSLHSPPPWTGCVATLCCCYRFILPLTYLKIKWTGIVMQLRRPGVSLCSIIQIFPLTFMWFL